MERQAQSRGADGAHQLAHEADTDAMLHLLNETSGAALCIAAEELRTNAAEASIKVKNVVKSHIAVSGPEKQKIIDEMADRLGRDQMPLWCTACGVRDPARQYEEDVLLNGVFLAWNSLTLPLPFFGRGVCHHWLS